MPFKLGKEKRNLRLALATDGMNPYGNLSCKHKDEPFIMAYQAKQMFYVTDPSNKRWSVVLQPKNTHGSDETLHISEISSSSTNVLTSIIENEVDDVHA